MGQWLGMGLQSEVWGCVSAVVVAVVVGPAW